MPEAKVNAATNDRNVETHDSTNRDPGNMKQGVKMHQSSQYIKQSNCFILYRLRNDAKCKWKFRTMLNSWSCDGSSCNRKDWSHEAKYHEGIGLCPWDPTFVRVQSSWDTKGSKEVLRSLRMRKWTSRRFNTSSFWSDFLPLWVQPKTQNQFSDIFNLGCLPKHLDPATTQSSWKLNHVLAHASDAWKEPAQLFEDRVGTFSSIKINRITMKAFPCEHSLQLIAVACWVAVKVRVT